MRGPEPQPFGGGRSWVAPAWFYGLAVLGGALGVAATLLVPWAWAPLPVQYLVAAGLPGVLGLLLGFAVGALVGPEHEDRVVRRRVGLPPRDGA